MGSSYTENIRKIALLFPGQGSQSVGMGKVFFDHFEDIKIFYEEANKILGYDIKKIIFEGPTDLLCQTEYTQPSIFLTSYVIFKCFEKLYPEILNHVGFVAGHSLGEYTAVCVSGALSFEDTLRLVSIRAKIMSEVAKNNPGGMIAVIGVERNELKKICEEITSDGFVVEPVNFNTPQQIVVAGSMMGIEKLKNVLDNKKIKSIKLNVSGAFHSSLMNDAKKIFSETLDKTIINNAFIPIIMNYDARPHYLANEIKENLRWQINNPVLWEDSLKFMLENGIEIFIELGPGKVLSGMVRKVADNKKILNIEDLDTLNIVYDFVKNNIGR